VTTVLRSLLKRAASSTKMASRIRVISAPDLIGGWTGKLWALNAGVKESAAVSEFYWFTDADVVHAPEALPASGFASGS